MRLWRLLLSIVSSWAIQVAANPSITVDLQASFASPPYILELLETAAQEKNDIYFPLLDRIAEGYFDSCTTDEQLYHSFLKLLQDDRLITEADSLSSFKFALAIRNAAARIEGHYQYYRTAVEPSLEHMHQPCQAWLQVAGKQYCDPDMKTLRSTLTHTSDSEVLPFDRILGLNTVSVSLILYADPSSKHFRDFHSIVSQSARDPESDFTVSYRLRYKPSDASAAKPLTISGYGVELALKRTDYIVIDDRQKASDDSPISKSTEAASTTADEFDNFDEIDGLDILVTDISPLSKSEIVRLALNAASFVVTSAHPLDTLVQITQNFPKHSTTLANHNCSKAFLQEYQANRADSLPAGYNVLWINGVQYDARKVDAFSLLDHLRRERKLISSFQDIGLSPTEAINLLSDKSLLDAATSQDSTRYHWTDQDDGGDVIIWLNDLEKDKRYRDWPSDLESLLQPTYPGQLPAVRRDINNAIVPLDLSKPESAQILLETIQNIIKRKIPLRWGIIPVGLSPEGREQSKVIYHLQDVYGLIAVFDYLRDSLAAKQKLLLAQPSTFKAAVEDRKPKDGKLPLAFDQLVIDQNISSRLENASLYLKRLGALDVHPPIFVNGLPIKHDDEWLHALSQTISTDIQRIQRRVYENSIPNHDIWLPSIFLDGASKRRNPFIIPANDKDASLINLPAVLDDSYAAFGTLPRLSAFEDSTAMQSSQLIVIADLDTPKGLKLATNAIHFRERQKTIQVVFVHNGKTKAKSSKLRAFSELVENFTDGSNASQDLVVALERLASQSSSNSGGDVPDVSALLDALHLQPKQSALILNSRLLGPFSSDVDFTTEDFDLLYEYEESKRTSAARKAILNHNLGSKIKDASSAAQIFSLIAASQVSDMPEGIFELPPPIRTNMFNSWKTEHSAFVVGDRNHAIINIKAALDPATETAQKWAPILKVLSELDGVSLQVFMNPAQQLLELPVKRFYRYVLTSTPSFAQDGSLIGGVARFDKIPAKALLTTAMDVPTAWLVASKDSIYDLDNIKLSSLSANQHVHATYQLEHILIEGHSRDVTTDAAPRGTQLLLSTATQSQVADTLIMANLGYFQFKANPGYYNIDLKDGSSKTIFNLDSVGSAGYTPRPGDESTGVALLSFQGVTLYPRLSRKPGMEEEDVLDVSTNKASEFVQQGTKLVSDLLKKAGFTSGDDNIASSHSEINIFSVASGHLYERMLNIMMVSVMRHTKHTVKFWFIEQFLSPAFKSFLPIMAKQYGFRYEMVTYKWPHWLRAQKEKQREIWGYKILFLDVLFPLDLDKVIFVDADQIVRTDMIELIEEDLHGAPYAFTPMGDSRTEMEGYRFWKQGYWKNFLRGLPYHISALYVVDLKRFRQLAAGDRLRQQYHQLSADPNSLSNLDQDLPNHMQQLIPIHSLNQNWLWCETWCSDESLKDAKTIDLCNNPETKEPKLDRARRQVPEWTEYDDEIAELARHTSETVLSGSIQEDELKERDRPVSTEKPAMTTSHQSEPSPSIKDEL